MRFLKGNVLFFALLLLAIMFFVYYSLGEVDADAGESASCRISFSDSIGGGEYKVFVDDSLLYSGTALPVDSQIVMKRYVSVNSSLSLYTSKSLIRVVAGCDTVERVLEADRTFIIGSCDGEVVVEAVEQGAEK